MPIKSSRIGKDVGPAQLEKKRQSDLERFIGSQELKRRTRDEVIRAMHASRTKEDFTNYLHDRRIEAVFRENDAGRIYGVTFIDRNTRMVLNGSRLGKSYSANVFEELFNNPAADRAVLLPKLLPQPTPETSPDRATGSTRPAYSRPQPEPATEPAREPDRPGGDDTLGSILGAFDILSIGLENEPPPVDELDEIRDHLAKKYRKRKKKKYGISR